MRASAGACSGSAKLIITCACLIVSVQWSFAQEHLYPSTFVGLIDVAPVLGLAPLFSCYFFALVAMLQQPCAPAGSSGSKQRRCGVLHGVKSLKSLCTIFTRVSLWYSELRLRGPWKYDWAPPMPRLVRDLSASFLVFLCLAQPELLPEEEDVEKAIARVEQAQATSATAWQQLQADLAMAHGLLDAALTAQHVTALAAVLSRAAHLVAAFE